MHEVSPSSPLLHLSGRWATTSSLASIITFWSGSTISFSFQGPILQLRTGPSTVRKDKFNGGTPMIACAVESPERSYISTYDAEGSEVITLIDRESTFLHGSGPHLIHITLIDWASVLEIQALVVSSDQDLLPLSPSPHPSLNILVIGDSISCGWTDGSQPMPLGCFDAFPFVLKRNLLLDAGIDICIDLAAFPGIRLVNPTYDELDDGAMPGMEKKFFKTSPWGPETPGDVGTRKKANILLLALGTNDEAEDVSPKQFSEALHMFLVRLIRLDGHKLQHICFVPPFPDSNDCCADETSESISITQCFSSIVDTVSQEPDLAATGIGFHEIKLDTYLHHEHLLDGLHPNIAGHRILGAALSRLMLPILQSCLSTGVPVDCP